MKLHHDFLVGTWDLVCGEEGAGNITAELGTFWAEVTIVWNKKNEDPKSAYGKNRIECL